MVISLTKEKDKIIKELKESELALTNKGEIDEIGEVDNDDSSQNGEGVPLIESSQNGANKKNGKSRIIRISIVLVLGYLLVDMMGMTSGSKGGFKPLFPEISFPLKLHFKEPAKSKELETKGDNLYAKGGYFNLLKASRLYTKSLGYDFDNRSVLGKTILSYAELYRDSKDPYGDSKVIMRLINIAERRIPNDINYIVGAAFFFHQADRNMSAVNIIERYLKINREAASLKLTRYYMLALLSAGMEKESEGVLVKLEGLDVVDIDVYLALVDYYMRLEEYNLAETVLKKALNEIGENIDLLIRYCEVLLYNKNITILSKVLEKIKDAEFGKSSYFYAQYLKYKGILFVFDKKISLALKYLKKSLSIKENDDLRERLSTLRVDSIDGDDFSIFIHENKTLRLIQESKKSLAQEDLNKAIAYAIKAVDLNSDYLPAVRQLAKIQRIKGHFQGAIDLLKGYIEKNNFSKNARLSLAEVYIYAFRFDRVEEIFSQLAEISPRQERLYRSLVGKYYLFKGHYIPAISELKKAIDGDPLNDELFFILADLYAQHNRFKDAKSIIVRAIELNPGIVAYRSLYGYLLYQLDGVDVAIGYTRKQLENFKDHPRLLGDIAKYYYKTGQQLRFEEQLKRIKSLPNQSADLYRSLFENALLEGNVDEMIKYGRELTNWAPGDLSINLEFAERLIEVEKYDEAFKVLSSSLERLYSFPRLHYLFAKVHHGKGEIEKAFASIDIEIKNNPFISDPYILRGQIYLQQNDLVEAKRAYTDAQKRDPENPEVLYGMGYVVFLLEQYEEGLEFFLKAAQIIPNDPKMRLMMGYTYEKMGQRKLAEESFKTYLELTTDSDEKAKIEAKIKSLR